MNRLRLFATLLLCCALWAGCAPRWVAREQARRAASARSDTLLTTAAGAPAAPRAKSGGAKHSGRSTKHTGSQPAAGAPAGDTAAAGEDLDDVSARAGNAASGSYTPAGGRAGADPTLMARGQAIAETARGLIGAPYVDGGAAPDGFDCSGLAAYVYARHGVKLPRSTEDQAQVGRALVSSEVLPGDLMFFRGDGKKITHVAIHVGGWRFVHAPRPGQKVRIDSLSDPYWAPRYAGARRP